MVLSGIGSGASAMMAQAKMRVRESGRDATLENVETSAVSTSGMKAGSLSESTSASSTPTPASLVASPANMMSDFFVKNTMETSKYIQATLTGLDLAAQMRDSMNADSFTLLDAAGGLFWLGSGGGGEDKYTKAVTHALEVDKLARNEKEQETIKASEEHLEETRDDIKQAADEATQGEADSDIAGADAAAATDETGSDTEDSATADTGNEADNTTMSANTDDATVLVPPEETLLKAPESAAGDTVVEAVERYQVASADAPASTVNAFSTAQTADQSLSVRALQTIGSRLDLLV